MNGFLFYDTTLLFINNDERPCNNWLRCKFQHYGLLHRIFNMMRNYGFEICNDMEVSKTIRKDHFAGVKGDLKFKASRYPKGFKVVFYQELVTVNSNGGYYDFDKFKKMPYLIKKQYILAVNKICSFLSEFAQNITKPDCRTAEDEIKYSYVQSCHHPEESMDFDLSELNGTTCGESYNNTDRDGKTIFNGDLKYFRDHKGYLNRGIVYHDLNNMWWVILNDTEIAKKANFQLFDISNKDIRKRMKKYINPESYIEKKQILSQCSLKELKNEIKRRLKNNEV